MYNLIRRNSRETLQATRSSFVCTLGHEELNHCSNNNANICGIGGMIGGGKIGRNGKGGKGKSSISYDYNKEDD